MVAAAGVIVFSDAAMSLDNVVALAAVSGGSFWLLAFGLVCTVPMIVFGSFGFTRLMKAFPLLVDTGAAMLGWVAGGMIVNDPVIADWVKSRRRRSPSRSLWLARSSCWFRAVSRGKTRKRRRRPSSNPRLRQSLRPHTRGRADPGTDRTAG